MKENLDSKIVWHKLPNSSMEERLDLVYKVAKENAKLLGIDINKIMDLFYKSIGDYKAKYNGKSRDVDLKKYAVAEVNNYVNQKAKEKETEEFIEYEKRFRRNQIKLL